MNTRHALFPAVCVAFVLAGRPRQTLAADGEPSFDELDLRRETTEVLKEAQKARLAGQSAEALKLYEQAYLYLPVKLVAAELGLMELQVGEYVDAARHLDQVFKGSDTYWDVDELRLIGWKGEEAQNHVAKRPGLSYRPSPQPIWPSPMPRAERPEWAKTLLYTSGVALGTSLAVGITGGVVYTVSNEESDRMIRHAGVGMMVGGAIGLGMSVTGLIIALGSTPPTVYQYYGNKPESPSALVITPQMGPRMVGFGMRGVF